MPTINNAAAVPAAPKAAAPAAPEKPAATTAEQAPAAAKAAEKAPALPADTLEAGGTGESSSIEAPPIAGGSFSSVGDPHETTGDGMKFDNMKTGTFVKLRAKSGDFELQTRQDPWDRNPQATVNTAAAVKVNSQGDKVAYDATNDQLTFNGKPIEVTAEKPFEVPGGGRIEAGPDGYKVVSAKGDVVNMKDRGNYLDVTGEVSAERRDGDVMGSLGRIDADTDWANDLVDRDGKAVKDIDAFIEAWRADANEDMFATAQDKLDAAGKDAPVEGEAKPVEGEGKPVEGEAKPAEDGDAPVGGEAPVEPKAEEQPDMTKLLDQLKALLTGGEPGAPRVDEAQATQLTDMLRKLFETDSAKAKQALGEQAPEAAAKEAPAAGFEQIAELLRKILELIGKTGQPAAAAA